MVDTIKISFTNDQMDNILMINTDKIRDTYQVKGEDGKITTHGSVKNMKVSFNESRLTICGSICKYFFNGQNQSTLNWEQLKQAIIQLGEDLNVPIMYGRITRIDVAENFIMSKPVRAYYDRMVTTNYYKRIEQPNGLYFMNGNRKITFYDKVREQKSKSTPIIEDFKGQNVLRYELSLMKNLDTYFNEANITVRRLVMDEQFYDKLVQAWCKEFMSIQKCRDVIGFDDKALFSVRAFKDQLSMKGIESMGGHMKVMKIIEDGKKENRFKYPKQYYDIRSMLRKFNEQPDLTIKNDLIQELEYMVEEALWDVIYAPHKVPSE